jgi:hypothetical protein
MSKLTTDEIEAAERELRASLNELRRLRGEPPLTELSEPPYCSFCRGSPVTFVR